VSEIWSIALCHGSVFSKMPCWHPVRWSGATCSTCWNLLSVTIVAQYLNIQHVLLYFILGTMLQF